MNLLTGVCLLAVATLAQLAYLRAHRRPTVEERPLAASVRWFAVAYPLVMGALFLVGGDLVATGGRWTGCLGVPDWLRGLGVVGMFAGTALFVAARRSLGEHYSPCFAARRPRAVVKGGAYRWLRHPMYVGNLTTIAGCALGAGSLLLACAWLVVAVAYAQAARDENVVLAAVGAEAQTNGPPA